MRKLLSLWHAVPRGGQLSRSVWTRLLLLVCMLSATQGLWAAVTTFTYGSSSGYDTANGSGTTRDYITVKFSGGSHSNSNGGYWNISVRVRP